MIELGLARISRLVDAKQLPWRAIHIAGTNGKGSTCAYVSSILSRAGLRCGRFTSPHLIDQWDCIAVAEKPITETLFRKVEAGIRLRDREAGIGASEFELLTATAFEIFTRQTIDVGVIEVGMGGRLDATNILENPLVTVITKIGLDHQNILGDTLEKIALEKAGILKPDVPCVADGSNTPAVLDILIKHAAEVGAPVPTVLSVADSVSFASSAGVPLLEPHQMMNLACAAMATKLALRQLRPQVSPEEGLSYINSAVRDFRWPGRLQTTTIATLTGRIKEVLIDGAHNAQSADVLAAYIARHIRAHGQPVTWVVAASQGKDLQEILGTLIAPEDNVAAVEFGPVDGMPWVRPVAADDLLNHILGTDGYRGRYRAYGRDLRDGLSWASDVAKEGPLVIAGSLYLVGDVMRLLRAPADEHHHGRMRE